MSRLYGVDQFHTGAAGFGKLVGEDTVSINERFTDDLRGATDVFPVASGGLHPGLLLDLLDATETNVCAQLDSGIRDYPDGTRAGTVTFRPAIDAYIEGRITIEAAEKMSGLVIVLDKWGTEAPRQMERNGAASPRL